MTTLPQKFVIDAPVFEDKIYAPNHNDSQIPPPPGQCIACYTFISCNKIKVMQGKHCQNLMSLA